MSGSGPTTTVQQQQNTSQSTAPYSQASPVINQVLAQLQGQPGYQNVLAGTQGLAQAGSAGNEFAPAVGNVANQLLGGGPDRTGTINSAYQNYINQLQPFTNQANLNPYNTPGFSDALSTLNNDISNQINSQFAGAGRDLSGMNTQTLARGLSQGEGQLLANQYNQNAQNYLNAAQGGFGAGAQTTGILSNLDQVKAALMAQGVSAADAAKQAQIWGPTLLAQSGQLPLGYLGQEGQIGGSLGSAFGTTTGQSTGTQTQQTNIPPWMMATGGILGGLSLGSRFMMNPQTGVLSNPFTGRSLFG